MERERLVCMKNSFVGGGSGSGVPKIDDVNGSTVGIEDYRAGSQQQLGDSQ